ncbi:hypothetical protein TVAG_006960 [Trichomonas vaginalis G3]|uniref:Uncharacterized protein n=1 Tax=Trichomonas vaginalis (strain ATCC PRA-98 / G3) TaxID=412133 RepID=A2FC19_TRIV3|nr:hypothetical protein TVAGG3_0963950 [Trichomonas vaginalis G3]EAX97565.1 hypothetical protein TVAG_006960 [Trichomonas vaginalis G3]KAI5488105.1 hypothetical protein TVAGG3_0963950 [Trichomonas vaginalis G3]|eukprot:XP_001310495.1 hypothetical protein [Trichomonas vaginalis G3]
MAGDASKIASDDKLNSNLARVEKLEIIEDGLLPYENEANTKSVKCDNEIPGINFYL